MTPIGTPKVLVADVFGRLGRFFPSPVPPAATPPIPLNPPESPNPRTPRTGKTKLRVMQNPQTTEETDQESTQSPMELKTPVRAVREEREARYRLVTSRDGLQEGRPLEHTPHWSNGEQPAEQQGRDSVGGSSEAGATGNAPQLRRTGLREDNETIIAEQLAEPANSSSGQAQPSLGRNPDGLTHRLDHAELHVSTDNRTDELRLLGNGVVPACAERAFRLLVGELMEHQP